MTSNHGIKDCAPKLAYLFGFPDHFVSRLRLGGGPDGCLPRFDIAYEIKSLNNRLMKNNKELSISISCFFFAH